jgi:hypothetical protein
MKTNVLVAFSLAAWVGVLLAFSMCQRDDRAGIDNGKQDQTNSGTKLDRTNSSEQRDKNKAERKNRPRKFRLPTEYEPTNNTTASKPRKDRDSIREARRNRTNSDGIDFNSTRSRRNTTTATNGTRPGTINPKDIKPAPAPTTPSSSPTYRKNVDNQ